MNEIRPLSALLSDLKDNFHGQEDVSVAQILEAFHERGFGFLIFIFALPAALPLPAVGLGTILALPLLFLTAQQAMLRHTIWLPERIKSRSFKRTTISGAVDVALPWMRRIERLVRPRLGFVTSGFFSRIIGVFGFLMTLVVLFPIPMTNTVPSMSIAIMAVGVMMRDGLAVILGVVVGLAWTALLFGALIFFGAEGLDILKDMIKSIL
jgi:hypothetical protein